MSLKGSLRDGDWRSPRDRCRPNMPLCSGGEAGGWRGEQERRGNERNLGPLSHSRCWPSRWAGAGTQATWRKESPLA